MDFDRNERLSHTHQWSRYSTISIYALAGDVTFSVQSKYLNDKKEVNHIYVGKQYQFTVHVA